MIERTIETLRLDPDDPEAGALFWRDLLRQSPVPTLFDSWTPVSALDPGVLRFERSGRIRHPRSGIRNWRHFRVCWTSAPERHGACVTCRATIYTAKNSALSDRKVTIFRAWDNLGWPLVRSYTVVRTHMNHWTPYFPRPIEGFTEARS